VNSRNAQRLSYAAGASLRLIEDNYKAFSMPASGRKLTWICSSSHPLRRTKLSCSSFQQSQSTQTPPYGRHRPLPNFVLTRLAALALCPIRAGSDRGVLEAAVKVVQVESAQAVQHELEQARRVQNDLIARRAKLRALHRTGCVGAEIEDQVRSFLLHNQDVLPGTSGSIECSPERFNSCPSAMSVHDALALLRADADARAPI